MVNKNWVNICFVIDESGSMYCSTSDVIGGFKKMIDEQKAIKDGKVTVSLYTFNGKVTEHYLMKDINDIPEFKYSASGVTAMNDGIGTAIDNVGKWLSNADNNGEEMPSKTIVVVMTDGMENSSQEYTLKQVQDKIKEQTDKYSWEFIYMGCDITTSKAADTLGFKFKTYGARETFDENYNIISASLSSYRNSISNGATMDEANDVWCTTINADLAENTTTYEKKLGRKISNE